MITNESNISLPLAVWLLHDDYDSQKIPNYISATTLMKPIRQIILPPRLEEGMTQPDVADYIARGLGKAIHDSIEKAWTQGYERSLRLMGYPENVIKRVVVNPDDAVVKEYPDLIPIYLEQRIYREYTVNGITYTIGGKFDLITDGIIQDAKSTSAYSWTAGTKDDDYRIQMSIYRWIDAVQPLPKIKLDFGIINFIFTDWQAFQAKSNPKYPQKRVESKEIPLMTLQETEAWIQEKLLRYHNSKNLPEDQLDECSDEELWRGPDVYKYYSDPAKAHQPGARSTKNFETMNDARAFQAEKGGKGVIITVHGEPKRCSYCEAFHICTQKDSYFP